MILTNKNLIFTYGGTLNSVEFSVPLYVYFTLPADKFSKDLKREFFLTNDAVTSCYISESNIFKYGIQSFPHKTFFDIYSDRLKGIEISTGEIFKEVHEKINSHRRQK